MNKDLIGCFKRETESSNMAKPFHCIPGPRGLPFIGSVLDYTSFGLFSYELMHKAKILNYRRYGPIYKEKLGRNIIELYDPRDTELVYRNEGEFPRRPPLPICSVACKRDKIKLGFGNLNGESWWRVRKTVAPAMLKPDAVVPFLGKQLVIAEDFVRLIDDSRKNNEKVFCSNLLELVRKFSIEAYGSICFNVRIGCLQPEVALSSDAHVIMTSSSAMFEAIQKTTFSFPTYAFFRTSTYNQFVKAFKTCQRLVRNYLEMNHGLEDNLFLDSLMHNNDNDNNNNDDNESDNSLTTDERIGICIDLFTAGVDATAFALCFLMYNLAKNPEKQEKLREEIASLVRPGKELFHSEVNNLSYLRSCIKESFRLNFPVQGGPIRELEKDLILSGYNIPKKTLVSMNFQTMCKLEEYFNNPESFIPERWMKHHDVSLQDDLHPVHKHFSSADYKHLPAFAFLPFGYGRRMCIGRRFAEQQLTLALIKVLQHYRLETTTQDLGMLNRIFTMPDRDIEMNFISLTH